MHSTRCGGTAASTIPMSPDPRSRSSPLPPVWRKGWYPLTIRLCAPATGLWRTDGSGAIRRAATDRRRSRRGCAIPATRCLWISVCALGAGRFCDYFEQFGLMGLTGIDLPGEAGTIMHARDDIGPVELATMTFGQSFQVTPVQMAATVSSLINGGVRVTPHVAVGISGRRGRPCGGI